MVQIFSTMAAVMAANVLTVVFLWGLARSFRIYRDQDLDWRTGAALIVPLVFFGACWLAVSDLRDNPAPRPLATVGSYKP